MSEDFNPETLSKLQEEIVALVTAWGDRGISPLESAMIISATTHVILVKSGMSLGQYISVVSDGWRKSGGKL